MNNFWLDLFLDLNSSKTKKKFYIQRSKGLMSYDSPTNFIEFKKGI